MSGNVPSSYDDKRTLSIGRSRFQTIQVAVPYECRWSDRSRDSVSKLVIAIYSCAAHDDPTFN